MMPVVRRVRLHHWLYHDLVLKYFDYRIALRIRNYYEFGDRSSIIISLFQINDFVLQFGGQDPFGNDNPAAGLFAQLAQLVLQISILRFVYICV